MTAVETDSLVLVAIYTPTPEMGPTRTEDGTNERDTQRVQDFIL
jgi:hypothetical protein